MKKINYKTIADLFMAVFYAGSIFAQNKKKTSEKFSDIDLVQLGPQEGVLFDTYVIGENSQSMTSTRWITSFKICIHLFFKQFYTKHIRN